jgi:hypothetical protein
VAAKNETRSAESDAFGLMLQQLLGLHTPVIVVALANICIKSTTIMKARRAACVLWRLMVVAEPAAAGSVCR